VTNDNITLPSKAELSGARLCKENFNGDGEVLSYLRNVRTTKDADRCTDRGRYTQGTDDMNDHDEWISYSHWGMFALERNSN
jgi:hypothetical protein